MTPEQSYQALRRELVTLGRAASVPQPAPDLVATVVARVAAAPQPAAPFMRRLVPLSSRRRRVLVAAAVALLVGLLAAPPVRAAVADWFGFAGIQVHEGSAPAASSAPAPPPAAGGDLRAARKLVAFRPVVPAELGRPDEVEVSADRRVLSMSWSGPDGPLRLDEFDGRLDYAFAKSAPDARFTSVAGEFALWFPAPHEVVVLTDGGKRRTESARLAGHTLVWTRGDVTLRLEGDIDLARAVEIAQSSVR